MPVCDVSAVLQRPEVWYGGSALAIILLAVLIVSVIARGRRRGGGRGRGRGGRAGGGNGSCVEIYVGNLSYDMTEAQLRQAFEKYGAVKSARIIENRYNKKSKGFGFVEMPVRSEAEAAVKALHDKEVMGRKMRVNEAKNKTRD
jgi:hypothetical protein